MISELHEKLKKMDRFQDQKQVTYISKVKQTTQIVSTPCIDMQGTCKNLETVFGNAKQLITADLPNTAESVQKRQSFDNAKTMLEAQLTSNTKADSRQEKEQNNCPSTQKESHSASCSNIKKPTPIASLPLSPPPPLTPGALNAKSTTNTTCLLPPSPPPLTLLTIAEKSHQKQNDALGPSGIHQSNTISNNNVIYNPLPNSHVQEPSIIKLLSSPLTPLNQSPKKIPEKKYVPITQLIPRPSTSHIPTYQALYTPNTQPYARIPGPQDVYCKKPPTIQELMFPQSLSGINMPSAPFNKQPEHSRKEIFVNQNIPKQRQNSSQSKISPHPNQNWNVFNNQLIAMNQYHKERSCSRQNIAPIKIAPLTNLNRNYNQPTFQQKMVQQRNGSEIVNSNSLISEKSHLRLMVSPSPRYIQSIQKVQYKHSTNQNYSPQKPRTAAQPSQKHANTVIKNVPDTKPKSLLSFPPQKLQIPSKTNSITKRIFSRNVSAFLKNQFFRSFNTSAIIGAKTVHLKNHDYYFPTMEFNKVTIKDADKFIYFCKDSDPVSFYLTFMEPSAGGQMLIPHNNNLEQFRLDLDKYGSSYNWKSDELNLKSFNCAIELIPVGHQDSTIDFNAVRRVIQRLEYMQKSYEKVKDIVRRNLAKQKRERLIQMQKFWLNYSYEQQLIVKRDIQTIMIQIQMI